MFSCIVTILLTAVILRYVFELENRKCPCSLTWQHKLIKYFAPVIILVCLLTLLMGQKGILDLTRKHNILGVLYMIYATVGIFYAVTLVLYFLKLRYSECECARDWKQYGLLYPVIGFSVIMLVLLIINAIMVFGQENEKSEYIGHYPIEELKYHPHQKPTDLYRTLVERYSNKNELILDPFMGSGILSNACLDRDYIGIDFDTKPYHQVVSDRPQ